MADPIRVIVVGAHPDEADMYAGGIAARFAELGHQVKFLSLTNGDAGHYELGGGPLAARRYAEAQEAAKRLGVLEYEVLDDHDGELIPTLQVRQAVIRRIRAWRADVVIGFHPNGGGHPDNRAAGKAVADAVSFVGLQNVVPTAPALRPAPVCLYMPDYGTQQQHRNDIVVDVDGTIEKKLLACDAHATQFYEFAPWGRGFLDQVPEGWAAKKEFLLKYWAEFMFTLPEMRASLAKWYGAEHAQGVRFAEAFQLADFGRRPDEAEIRRLFPMLGERTSHPQLVEANA
jgi:LmbE family N-acetylglucosaminyl deacetylase